MHWIGQKQLGDIVRFYLRTTNSSGVPTQPNSSADSAPLLRLYATSGLVESTKMALIEYPEQTGYYYADVVLDSAYATGHYSAHATWSTGSGAFTGSEHWQFRIIAGGSTSGTVVAMQELDRPGMNIVVGEYDIGTLFQGRNPS